MNYIDFTTEKIFLFKTGQNLWSNKMLSTICIFIMTGQMVGTFFQQLKHNQQLFMLTVAKKYNIKANKKIVQE